MKGRPRRASFILSIVAIAWSTEHVVVAQSQVEFAGPRMGYVFDTRIQQIRPVLGITGSARIGDPFPDDSPTKDVVLFPGRDFAIAFPENGGSPRLLGLATETLDQREFGPLMPNPSKASLSPGGSSLALYYASSARILIVNGLPENPEVKASIDVSGSLGDLHRLTINDEGTLLVAALSSEGRDNLLSWKRHESLRLLTTAARVTSLMFLGNDVVVADSGASEVFLLQDIDGAVRRVSLTPLGHELSDTVVTTLSERGEIYVATIGNGYISVLDVEGRLREKYDCRCAFSGFFPLSNTIFRLTERLDQPIYILDVGAPSGRLAFIPAVQ